MGKVKDERVKRVAREERSDSAHVEDEGMWLPLTLVTFFFETSKLWANIINP